MAELFDNDWEELQVYFFVGFMKLLKSKVMFIKLFCVLFTFL